MIIGASEDGLVFKKPKTKKSLRSIPLSNKIIKVLQNYKIEQDKIKFKLGNSYVDNDLLFCIENGKPKDPRNLFRKFKDIIEEAGLPDIRFHDLRHTFATLALEEGVSMKVLQEILGHSSITTTIDTYSHVTTVMNYEAAEKIGRIFD